MPHRDLINLLVTGFKSFRLTHYERRPEVFEQLVRGQAPKAMVIACCDSRVDPAIILDAQPGELFVVRNVANLVPPCEQTGSYHGTSAALEFAVRFLQVQHIIVLGHSQCGGIRALVERGGDAAPGGFIQPWMSLAAEARRRAMAEHAGAPLEVQAQACEQSAIAVSLRNLTSFPWIREAAEAGRLHLHGWYFDLQRGALLGFDAARSEFVRLDGSY